MRYSVRLKDKGSKVFACSYRAVYKATDIDVLKIPKDLAQQDWDMQFLG